MEQDKIKKTKRCQLKYFVEKNFFVIMVLKMFLFIREHLILEKNNKSTNYVLSWKSKGVYTFKFKPLYTVFLHSITLYGCKMGINFDTEQLAAEQNNKIAKIVNAYIAYDFEFWSRNPTNNFKFKICLFGVTSIVKKYW